MIKEVTGFARELVSSCPYTNLVKKVFFRARKPACALKGKKVLSFEERIKIRKTNMRAGIFVMLIGLLCPIFWISLFSGVSAKVLLFDFLHSSVFILGGLIVFMYNKVKLNRIIRERSGIQQNRSESIERSGVDYG